MLNFIYCGKIENMKHHAVNLLKAAEQFQIINLKGKDVFFLTNKAMKSIFQYSFETD